jgi:CRP/FNR family transcriptional regulator, cyclic AMP receptor protein
VNVDSDHRSISITSLAPSQENTTVDPPAHLPIDSLLSRFSGPNGRLREALASQLLLAENEAARQEVAQVAKVEGVHVGGILIQQDDAGTDLFFILSGQFRVLVNGREVAVRGPGHHVGEMAIIDPSARRTATVIASEPAVVARLSEHEFLRIADSYPTIWRAISRELARRLDTRKKFHRVPNAIPNVFLGSSTESRRVAETLLKAMPPSVAHCILWTDGVFGASSFPIDDLERSLKVSDFAVLVVANDDKVISRRRQSFAPRDNVIFELGLFMGGLSRSRTFLLPPQGINVKIPSDLMGLNTLHPYSLTGANVPDVTKATDELVAIIQRTGCR